MVVLGIRRGGEPETGFRAQSGCATCGHLAARGWRGGDITNLLPRLTRVFGRGRKMPACDPDALLFMNSLIPQGQSEMGKWGEIGPVGLHGTCTACVATRRSKDESTGYCVVRYCTGPGPGRDLAIGNGKGREGKGTR